MFDLEGEQPDLPGEPLGQGPTEYPLPGAEYSHEDVIYGAPADLGQLDTSDVIGTEGRDETADIPLHTDTDVDLPTDAGPSLSVQVQDEVTSPPDYTNDFATVFGYLAGVDPRPIILGVIQEDPAMLARYTHLSERYGNSDIALGAIVDEHPTEVDEALEFELERTQAHLAEPLERIGLFLGRENVGISDPVLFTRALAGTDLESLGLHQGMLLREELGPMVRNFISGAADRLCAENLDSVRKLVGSDNLDDGNLPRWLQRYGHAEPELVVALLNGAPPPEVVTDMLRCAPSIAESMERNGFDLETKRQFHLFRAAAQESMQLEWATAYRMGALAENPAQAVLRNYGDVRTLLQHVSPAAPHSYFAASLLDSLRPYVAI